MPQSLRKLRLVALGIVLADAVLSMQSLDYDSLHVPELQILRRVDYLDPVTPKIRIKDFFDLIICHNQSYSDFHQFDELPNALHANTSSQLKLCADRNGLVDRQFVLIGHGRLADGLIFNVMTSESGKVSVDRCYWRCLFI